MSEKFILFNDEKINPSEIMMLTDLSKLILKDNSVKVKFQKFAYYDPLDHTMNVSFKWRHRPAKEESAGLKSDCILFGYGHQLTDYTAALEVKQLKYRHEKFCKQLYSLFEEIRLTKAVIGIRPASRKFFLIRYRIKLASNKSQIHVYETKKVPTDLLFLKIEQAVMSENTLDFTSGLPELMETRMKVVMEQSFNNASTRDSLNSTIAIMEIIDEWLDKDMLNDYYYYPESVIESIADTCKTAAIAGNDMSDTESNNEQVMTRQKHTQSKGTYLEAEVQEGRMSKAMGSNAREGDASDEATEFLAGKGKSSNQMDGDGISVEALGSANMNVSIQWKYPVADEEDIVLYNDEKRAIMPEVKKLTNVILKTIDHQHQNNRENLAFGLLSRNLVSWFTDDKNRMFYNKDQESKELDATFTLLVDASYSMNDKLEETIKGIILFHETLLKLAIRHEVIAFNEDTFNADDKIQPNIFDYLINYHDSLNAQSGPNIMTIKAQDDNRDGLAIRTVGQMLKRRVEKQKFLLVFSDGEPSAFNYDTNGIIDTHEAVNKLRREGIFVINIFLSQNKIDDAIETTIRNIYGDYCVFVEGVEHLPGIISPLLKRLLLQSLMH